jgi:glycosyltransferase involved in cell wall biosynthesis
MEVLHFDARFIRLDQHDGISRFSVELIKALNSKIKVVAIIYDLRQLDHLPEGMEFLVLNNPQSISEFLIARKLNKAHATHVFSPMQVMGTAGRKFKLVLTLHDLIYYRHRKPPQDLSYAVQLLWRLYHLSYLPQRLLLNRADAVATVSKTTKALMESKRLTKRKIGVVYNAPPFLQALGPREFPKSRKVVYIGSFMPYKNVETLIRGAALTPEFELHLLSKIELKRREELELLAKSTGANVVFHGGVSDLEYQNLLREAFALVSASRDEGFGIPLVEAMQVGTPVVISDLDIFREVAGVSGIFFPADSPEGFAEGLISLLEPDNWKLASKHSIAQASSFNWDDSADLLLELFRQIR